MRKLFHEVYSDTLNQIRSTLLRYHIEFEQLKSKALNDYTEGKISDGGYKFATSMKISEYYTVNAGQKSSYCLSKEQVDFIKKYAALNEKGDMLLDSLKPEYVEKSQKLNTIFESIRTFQFFCNLSLADLREVLSQIVGDNYDNSIKKVEEAKEKGASEVDLDGNVYKAELFNFVISKLQLHKTQSIGRIEISSKEELINLIEQYYGIDYSYYAWFRAKKLQEDSQNVDIALGHERQMRLVDCSHSILQNNVLKYQNKVDEINSVSTNYQQFLTAVMAVPGEGVVTGAKKERFVGILFRKKNNLEELRELFGVLASLPGVSRYLETLNGNDAFQAFMDSTYPGETYISPGTFKTTFVNKVNEYYLATLADLGKELESSKTAVSKSADTLTDNISIAQEEAAYRTEMVRSLGLTPKLEGMTDTEEATIFTDMKEYFANEPELRYDVVEMRRIDELRTGKGHTK